jgi:subfamily B ATP-binding cassette protein MsbA
MIAFLLKVWGLARPYRGRLFLGVLTGVISGFIEPLMIATIAFVYALIFPSKSAPGLSATLNWAPTLIKEWLAAAQDSLRTGVSGNRGAVVALVGVIPAVIFLRGLFSYLNIYYLQWAAVRAITDLRVRLFDHLMNQSASFFNRANTGELMSRILNDTGMLQNVISNTTSTLVKDPVTVASLLAYLMWEQPKLTLISMVVLPICMIPIVIYNRKVRQSSKDIQTQLAELAKVMIESFTGNRIIKAYNLENTVVGQFRRAAGKFIGHYMRIVRSSETPGPVLELLGAIGISFVLVYLAFRGGVRATSSDFLKIILIIFSLYRPLKNLTRLQSNLEAARASSQRVFELLATENIVPEPAQPKPLRAAGARIEFQGVEFAYGDKVVLRDIDLAVQPGQLVALVGASGSGKTTLTNLLLRFYDPRRGVIRIGGTDLREAVTRDLRNQIAVVTQETILFDDTIRNNIALGRAGAANGEIEEAARHAFAHDFIMEKPDGYETLIGEKGVMLSGGQRQRIAIARAILKNAPILVLDEATSSLDTESERAVQAALEELMQGRTTICIAHRLSTVQKAHRIVVMDGGRIVESGTHAELIQARGVYCKLYEMQFP